MTLPNFLVEGGHGHGGKKRKIDLRDHKVKRLKDTLGNSPAPFNWTTAPQLLDVIATLKTPTKDQGVSSSCGSQSGSYYAADSLAIDTGTFVELSAHDLYSTIWYPGGGTTMRDIFNRLCQRGIVPESIVPSYVNGQPMSELQYEDKSYLTPQIDVLAHKSERIGYAFANTDIDSVASAISINNGCLIMGTWRNNGTWESLAPLPPGSSTNPPWTHFLYVKYALAITPTELQGLRDGIITLKDIFQKYGKTS